jgi:hypothetical protein
MPPKLSARHFFWVGLGLTAAGLFVAQYLVGVVYGLWGPLAINTGPWPALMNTLGPVLVPLGVVMLACSLIARVIETQSDPTLRTSRWRPMPPMLTARQVLWTGVVLSVVGFILTGSISDLLMGFQGSSDLSSKLARDLLEFVGLPVTVVALPLGIALVPCAFIVRMLESRVSDPRALSAEEFSGR